MNRLCLMLAGILVVSAFCVLEADARPDKRFDETTQTCRVLDQGQLEWDSRPWGEGGKVFKQVCKSCHTRDNDKGAPFLWVESKSSKAWNRVFFQKYPKCSKNGSWDDMTLDQQLKLNDYLFRFGENSMDLYDSG